MLSSALPVELSNSRGTGPVSLSLEESLAKDNYDKFLTKKQLKSFRNTYKKNPRFIQFYNLVCIFLVIVSKRLFSNFPDIIIQDEKLISLS